MIKMTQKTGIVITVLIILSGSAWGGWFTFEPDLILLDGTPVALNLEDIQKRTDYLKKGDMAKANQLVEDEKIYIIKNGRDQTRVKFLEYEEHNGSVFVLVKNESGTKLWANMTGLACECEGNGKQRKLTKEAVVQGKIASLSEPTQ